MKKNFMIVIFIMLSAILVIFTSLILHDLYMSNEKIEEKNDIILNDWDIEKKEYYYILSYNVQETMLSTGKYNVYVLDINNNLLYNINNVNFTSVDNGKFYMTHVVEYDISNINSIVITTSNNKITYNDDLRKSVEYIGEVTTTKQPEIIITTQQTNSITIGE